MAPWNTLEHGPLGGAARPKIGDRVEVFFSADPSDVHMRGILLGVRYDGTHVILGDGYEPYYPNGQPVTFRADQVRAEVSEVVAIRGYLSEMQKLMRGIELDYESQSKRRFRLTRLVPLAERDDYRVLTATIKALQVTRTVAERLDREIGPAENVAHEIIYKTPEGIENDPVIATLREGDHKRLVECTFLFEFRGWRYIQFGHGGIHAYRATDVRFKRPRRRKKTEAVA